jgi:ABC-2 type transport system ATP-binding protein
MLDEPTAGVDVELRQTLWKFIARLNREGHTVVLTTHYLEEAENLCRNIAIIDGGRIIENNSMSTLLRRLQTESFLLSVRTALTEAPQLEGYRVTLVDDHTIEVEVTKDQGINDIFARLSAQGIDVLTLRNKVNRLEEMFMRLVENRQP